MIAAIRVPVDPLYDVKCDVCRETMRMGTMRESAEGGRCNACRPMIAAYCYDPTDIDAVSAAAVRLYDQHGFVGAEIKASDFARRHGRGSSARAFWFAVAQSVADNRPVSP